jgi:hypothetical protein
MKTQISRRAWVQGHLLLLKTLKA